MVTDTRDHLGNVGQDVVVGYIDLGLVGRPKVELDFGLIGRDERRTGSPYAFGFPA